MGVEVGVGKCQVERYFGALRHKLVDQCQQVELTRILAF